VTERAAGSGSGPTAATAGTATRGASRGTLAQRLRANALDVLSWIVRRLPEGVALALTDFGGDLWYRVTPDRRGQARRNLRRVVGFLAATGRGSHAVQAAASDPVALERLVRSAYRHAARYYLEMIRIPWIGPSMVRDRLVIETPDTVETAFGANRPVIFVAPHFGSIELPALYLAERTGRIATVPMETVGDPALQDWLVRSRSRAHIRIIGLREARHELAAALERGESVGLVGDRDILGSGGHVSFFGAPARLPMGPGLLSLETGAPVFVAAVRRAEGGTYRGQLREIGMPTEGTRRERLTAVMDDVARAFEASVAEAPDQWWTVFYPIWPDLEREAS
jgi:phosphatidylinositol dimannoside acyltransferase